MGLSCSTHRSAEEVYTFYVGNLKRRDNSEDVGIDGRL